MKPTTSELERRSQAALKNLEDLGERVKNGVLIVREGPAAVSGPQILNQNGKYVVKTAESDGDRVAGAEKTRSVGGGVQARLVKRKSDGKYFVESLFFDRDRFSEDSVRTWIEKHQQSIVECIDKIQEAAPSGSFTDIAMRVQRMVTLSDFFMDGFAYICWMFSDYCVVDYRDKLYRVSYSDEAGVISLGDPVEVDTQYVAKEVQIAKERADAKSKPNFEMRDSVAESLNLKETDASKREAVVILIEAGMNHSKRRYYPKNTIQEATSQFSGLKNYMNHPTSAEEQQRPERDVKDWVSTITETWYEDGKMMARVKVHDDWLWEHLQDPVFREHVALSINASGRRYYTEMEGKQVEVVEQITTPKSVDWVTEPGARGRVEYLLEQQQHEGDISMLNTVKLAEVKTARPDLIEAIKAETREEMKAENQKAIDEAVKPFKIAEAKRALESMRDKVTKLAEKSALPKKIIPAFVEKFFKNNADATEDTIEAKVKEAVAAEVKYLQDSGLSIKVGVDAQAAQVKEAGEVSKPSDGLLEALGVADKKAA